MTFEEHVNCTREHCEIAFDCIDRAREGIDLIDPSIHRTEEFKEQLQLDRENVERKICRNIEEAMRELLAVHAAHLAAILEVDALMARTVGDTVDLGMLALSNLSARFTLSTKTLEPPPEAKRAALDKLMVN